MQYLTSKKGSQMSDAFYCCIFTLSGGFQDAYTYFCRDGVFANAQTGNIVFMSSYFMKGILHTHYDTCCLYLRLLPGYLLRKASDANLSIWH